MLQLGIRQAMLQAVLEEMERGDQVYLWGEGIGSKVAFDYPALIRRFPGRIQTMPISEACIVGAGLGAALVGLRPVVDLSFDDLVPRAMDEILNDVAKVRFVTGGASKSPLVVKIDLPPVRCAQTGQRLESMFMHIPGLLVAVPSTPHDAKGLMKSSLRGGDPVIMVEDRWIEEKELVSEDDYEVPFGEAAIRRRGDDVTILTYGFMVKQALEVARQLSGGGLEIEVIDLRTLSPLDAPSIFKSVRKTGRVVIVEGGWRSCGVGAELSSMIVEECMDSLQKAPVRVAAKMTHIPTSSALRMNVFPSNEEISEAVKTVAASGE